MTRHEQIAQDIDNELRLAIESAKVLLSERDGTSTWEGAKDYVVERLAGVERRET
jgi:hypothetical protein